MKSTLPNQWVIMIDDVIIPQKEYEWTEDGNFYFSKTITELANIYCSINQKYEAGDKVKVSMRMQWEVKLE